jgi:sugar phosphate isomerase/epimerase
MFTRREFTRTLVASSIAVPVSAQSSRRFSSRIQGVQIGAITYSYRSLRGAAAPYTAANVERLIDRVASAFVEDGIDCAEFWIGMIEPPRPSGYTNPTDPAVVKGRQNLRQWRKDRPFEIFSYARKKFTDSGVDIFSAMFNFDDECNEDELNCAFEMADVLGTNRITANCTVKSIRRAAPFAEKHRMIVAAHGEIMPADPELDGMVFADNLADAIRLSPYVWTAPDTGHMTRYGQDVLKFVREHHDRISSLHLKEGLKNHPEFHNDHNTPEWGQGNVPFRELLQLMKTEKYSFPACIEYEYPGKGTAVEEVKRCLDFCRAILA